MGKTYSDMRARAGGVGNCFFGNGLDRLGHGAVLLLKGWSNQIKRYPALKGYDDTLLPSSSGLDLVQHKLDAAERVTLGLTTSWMLQWARHGLPVFNVTRSLASALVLTSPAPEPQLRLPFPAIMIRMPFPESPLAIDTDRGEEPVSHLQISTHRFLSSGPGGGEFVADLPLATLADQPWSEWVYVVAYTPSGIGMTMHHRAPSACSSMGEWIDDHRKNRDDGLLTARDHRELAAIKSFVAVFASYLEERAAAQVPTRRASRLGASKRLMVFHVGAEVKLPSHLHDAARAYASGARRDEWAGMTRYVVRGHMHRFWHGPRGDMDQRRLVPKWVAPYWKGPETGIMSPRTYAVDQEKSQ